MSRKEKEEWKKFKTFLKTTTPETAVSEAKKKIPEVLNNIRGKGILGNENKGLAGLYNAITKKNIKLSKQLEILSKGEDGSTKIIGIGTAWDKTIRKHFASLSEIYKQNQECKKFCNKFIKIFDYDESKNDLARDLEVKIQSVNKVRKELATTIKNINDKSKRKNIINEKIENMKKEANPLEAKNKICSKIKYQKIEDLIDHIPKIFKDICNVISNQLKEIYSNVDECLENWNVKSGEITKSYQRLKRKIPKELQEISQDFFKHAVDSLNAILIASAISFCKDIEDLKQRKKHSTK